MSDPVQSLKPTQVQALVVLMAEARGLTNAQLKELAGFVLTGADRKKLVERGLITSEKSDLPRKPYLHSLTDYGWREVRQLHQARPKGANSAVRTLLCLLGNVTRSLEARRVSTGEFFSPLPAVAPEPVAPAQATPEPVVTAGDLSTEAAVRVAYGELARPGEWLALADLRAKLAGADRAALDGTLRAMARQDGVRIIPVADSKNVSSRDREAALRIGDEDNHAITITAGA